MKTYQSNYKYYLALFILIVFSGFVFLSTGIWNLENISFFGVSSITILLILWIGFLLWLPKEITIRENTLELKTLLMNKKIYFSRIRGVKSYYSTKSKMWHGGNEEKADMLCVIRLKGNLFNLFILTNAINEYKELYQKIKTNIETV